MGLDQYAYTLDQNGEKTELAYWRKHPNLHGFMEHLWHEKGCPTAPEQSDPAGLSNFNCVPLALDEDDLDRLEADVNGAALPATVGFFFGDNSDEYYKNKDLEFIAAARKALAEGKRVFYDSWW